ncbi:amidohydrolase family protein [Rubrobacter marinus]|uniref:Amidohydrolase family protein n=1 Tax=Rubrobacter marinus TaxID=2653852 RepID=A0A6G8PW91_9ACTN|nr:amidohydrolase family protein [Rubrobacter marinus]QIN78474.1 amidohydrolase family protein [Rubrobacter marinus]
MAYDTNVGSLPDVLATVRQGRLHDPLARIEPSGRTILKGGTVIDPANGVEAEMDVAFRGQRVEEVADGLRPERGDRVFNVRGLQVWPGLIDIHLHLGDLFETSSAPIFESVADGVTVALSPGAGNSFMSPSLLGAEVDRGVPVNVGLYLGGPNVMGCLLSVDELVDLFNGELPEEVAYEKMTRNPITYLTAPLTVGLKDHMGHFIAPDEMLDGLFDISSRAGLVFMSHAQDPAHSERLVHLSNGRPVHLTHLPAAGSGSHGDPVESMRRMVELLKQPHVTGDLTTSHLRPGLGNRDGILMDRAAQQVAYEALADGTVDVLISDGQCDATMKGFGDTRDNVPAILELAEAGVLPLSRAVATMTANVTRLMAGLTREDWWTGELGHLGAGTRANVTVVDPHDKLPTFVFVNGVMAAMENRPVREANGAGGWVTKFGILDRTGVGDLAAFAYHQARQPGR